jgi:hypothetical protein
VVVYCLPSDATQVLSIGPSIQIVSIDTTTAGMEQHPEDLGRLFEKEANCKTAYERAVTKFGEEKVIQAIGECIPVDFDNTGALTW